YRDTALGDGDAGDRRCGIVRKRHAAQPVVEVGGQLLIGGSQELVGVGGLEQGAGVLVLALAQRILSLANEEGAVLARLERRAVLGDQLGQVLALRGRQLDLTQQRLPV